MYLLDRESFNLDHLGWRQTVLKYKGLPKGDEGSVSHDT